MAQPAHLNIYRDARNSYFVEIAQGADRITITPALPDLADAMRILQGVQSWTQLTVGRVV